MARTQKSAPRKAVFIGKAVAQNGDVATPLPQNPAPVPTYDLPDRLTAHAQALAGCEIAQDLLEAASRIRGLTCETTNLYVRLTHADQIIKAIRAKAESF